MGMGVALGVSVGMSALQGLAGADQQKQQQQLQKLSGLRNEYVDLQQINSYNKAAEEANATNKVRANIQSALLQMQRANKAKDAVNRMTLLGDQENQMLGSANAQAAASGSFGNSVDAVKEDIKNQMDKAQENEYSRWMNESKNFQTMAMDLSNQINDSFVSAKDQSIVQRPISVDSGTDYLSIFGNALLGGIGQYASAKMKLGLGTIN